MARRINPWNPNTAAWLVAQRGKRTQDAVVADMQSRGVKLERAWLSRIENGAPFSAELLDAFQDYYGSVPPPYEPVEDQPASDLIGALAAQTKALTALVDELRSWRTEDHAKLGDLELAVRALAGPALDGPATPEDVTPHVPGGTKG